MKTAYVRFEQASTGNWTVAVYHDDKPKKPVKEEVDYYTSYVQLEQEDFGEDGEPRLFFIDKKYRPKLIPVKPQEPKIKIERVTVVETSNEVERIYERT